ncbi:MAG TPA: hypothetical protein VK845_15970 [Gemmatimonadales bacterium]|nr:hypothetical protein [Gemmatimonadales bacterium]
MILVPVRIPGPLAVLRLCASVLVTVAFAAAATAQENTPTVRLGQPNATYDEPFSALSGLRELSDGTLLVGDRIDQVIQHVDLASGSGRPVGRKGAGPGEYDTPMGLYALPNDSTLVFDMGNNRFLVLTPEGKPGDTFMPTLETGGGPGARFLSPPRGVDNQGGIYFAGQPMRAGASGMPESIDSSAIIRYDRTSRKVDTLGLVKAPAMNIQASGDQNRRELRIRPAPMPAQDEWGVTPDGRIGIARVGGLRVEWLAPDGSRAAGAAFAYKPIKVSKADYRAWQKRMGSSMGREIENGRSRLVRVPLPEIDEREWPDYKPPFLAGAVAVAPSGELWLLRTRPADDPTPVYEVFDASGKLVRRVQLPPKTEVAGFGKRSVYLVRIDEDDLQWLERYRL